MSQNDFDFVTQMTRGFIKDNPNHMRAARHLLCDIGLDSPRAIVAMSSVLDMTPSDAYMYDTSRRGWSSSSMITRETQDLLIDWLGKRPVMNQYLQKESVKLENAHADLMHAKEICTSIQQVIPFLNTKDPERLELLQHKYLAVVAPAHDASGNHAFLMGEYIFFLDMFLVAHPSTRVLGKAVFQAWIYLVRAHEQDRKIKDAKFGRMRWFMRMHRGYIGGDRDCLDKVLLPDRYLAESGSMPGDSKSFDWDTEGDPDLVDLLKEAASHCATCQKVDGNLKGCGACHKTFYCSKDCQKFHWKAGHKQLCKAWS